MFTLKGGHLPPADVKNIIFFVRPRLELMDIIADNVLSEDKIRCPQRDFHILFVPRRSLLCEQRLKELGVLHCFVHREEYSLDLIPFDGDLLSMESENAFKECYLENDQTSLYHAAKGLMTLQALYGTIPLIFGKGECARHVANMMIRMKREFSGIQNPILPVFDTLLLLDRNVDLISPLATQLTYEGLIDEIYGIQNTYVKLPPEKFAPKKQGEAAKELPTEAKKLQLNSAEELYAEIRDKNFNAVGSVLSKKAKIISAAFEVEKFPDTSEDFFDNLTVEQEFMSGIDTDKINSYVEDCIARKYPLIKILRLVCLQSVCNSGLKQKVLDHYKREILQVRLFPRQILESIKINQSVFNIPPPLLPPIIPGQHGENRITLVFFLGGVTYAEIAALRFLSQMEDGGTEYVIATTKLINGTSWIKSMMEKLEPLPF
ncbi:PREDICTED: vacuolar protein sorting-associated protein 33A [Thamnophis sirtalis]|uniref:Vacuolar protein sorting-associated protein 33A n=1 Tax=Thamnophis sirtalis TaxID=35019 RepID=A0A6I9YLA0_9SAUR|nr:PREDICTED: vacuolar protein sorting-associated protein 33A [Thamnophis sirtalis]